MTDTAVESYKADLARRAAELADQHGYADIIAPAFRALGLPLPEQTRRYLVTATLESPREFDPAALAGVMQRQANLWLQDGRTLSGLRITRR